MSYVTSASSTKLLMLVIRVLLLCSLFRASSPLEEWLDASGVEWPHVELGTVLSGPLSSPRRGVIATGPAGISRGGVIMKVPRALMLSAHDVACSAHLSHLIVPLVQAGLSEEELLALVVLSEIADGVSSPWAAVLDDLDVLRGPPTSTCCADNLPWAEEAEGWSGRPRPSSLDVQARYYLGDLFELTATYRDHLREVYEVLLSIRGFPSAVLMPNGYDDWTRSMAVVLSRSFGIGEDSMDADSSPLHSDPGGNAGTGRVNVASQFADWILGQGKGGGGAMLAPPCCANRLKAGARAMPFQSTASAEDIDLLRSHVRRVSVLVPGADLLNHRQHDAVRHSKLATYRFRDISASSKSGGSFVIYAPTDAGYGPGEEVLHSYGSRTNAELLTRFGFVELDNPSELLLLRPSELVPLPLLAAGDGTGGVGAANAATGRSELDLLKLRLLKAAQLNAGEDAEAGLPGYSRADSSFPWATADSLARAAPGVGRFDWTGRSRYVMFLMAMRIRLLTSGDVAQAGLATTGSSGSYSSHSSDGQAVGRLVRRFEGPVTVRNEVQVHRAIAGRCVQLFEEEMQRPNSLSSDLGELQALARELSAIRGASTNNDVTRAITFRHRASVLELRAQMLLLAIERKRIVLSVIRESLLSVRELQLFELQEAFRAPGGAAPELLHQARRWQVEEAAPWDRRWEALQAWHSSLWENFAARAAY